MITVSMRTSDDEIVKKLTVCYNKNLVNSVQFLNFFQYMLKYRLSSYRHQGLWHIECQRIQPCCISRA